jgi:hypothetical protein
MGAASSLPETARRKHTGKGAAHGLTWGVSAMQGHRPTMEVSKWACLASVHDSDCARRTTYDSQALARACGEAVRTVQTILPALMSERDARWCSLVK